MSDELFPEKGGDQYEYEDEDEGKSLIQKIKSKIRLPQKPGLLWEDKEDEEEDKSSDISQESVSFLKSDEEEEESELSRIRERFDRFTVLLLTIELLLLVYLAAATLGFAPFF